MAAPKSKPLRSGGGKPTYTLAELPDFERIPTGMACLDLFTSGGIPLGTNSLFTGPPGSGKTVTVTATLANYLRRFPDKSALYLNADNKLTKDILEMKQGDGTRVETIYPETAAESQDAILHTADKRKEVGIVVVDSLGSLTSDREVIGGEEIGILAKENNKFLRKFTALQLRRAMTGNPLTLLLINQERRSVGLFSTRFPPGGKQQEFQAALWVEFDKSETHFNKRTKIPIADTFKYHFRKNEGGAKQWSGETRMATFPHGRWRVGDYLDHAFTFIWAVRCGVLQNHGNQGWGLDGQKLHQPEWIEYWEANPTSYAQVKGLTLAAFIAIRKSEREAKFLSGEEESPDEGTKPDEEAVA